MRHLAYAVVLAAVLAGTLPLHRLFGLTLAHQLRRVTWSVLPVFVVFVAWDVAATHAGHWRFDPAQVLPPRLAGLPLEEVAFFVVIPLAGLLTYEAVGVVLRRGGLRDKAARAEGGRPDRSPGAADGPPPDAPVGRS